MVSIFSTKPNITWPSEIALAQASFKQITCFYLFFRKEKSNIQYFQNIGKYRLILTKCCVTALGKILDRALHNSAEFLRAQPKKRLVNRARKVFWSTDYYYYSRLLHNIFITFDLIIIRVHCK